ncbi:MAG: uracil-DNA glycosylase [Alphaproteobacteria bacterium]|nr:uracil-DNA glycosylase [Alphaproteobacteria bacterium]
MDARAMLLLQIEWGADEALDPVARDRRRPPDAPPAVPAAPLAAAPMPAPAVAARVQPVVGRVQPPAAQRAREVAAGAATLAALREALAGFDGCPLAATATNLVFADGNPEAGLMFVGEGPGAEEDQLGKPFVGPSGRFLDRMLASIGLDRTKYVITNLIPWRPPGNRNPTDAEVLTCLPFLLRHIALVQPRHLVLLGALAARAVLGGGAGITRLRGRWHQASIPGLEAPVAALPMLHPAYLLRNAGAKRDAWADLLLLRRTLDGR